MFLAQALQQARAPRNEREANMAALPASHAGAAWTKPAPVRAKPAPRRGFVSRIILGSN